MREGYIVAVLTVLLPLAGCLSEPNAHNPVIHSDILNKHGKPMFYGKIREDETAVEFEEGKGLKATDDDSIGAAGFICAYKIVKSRKRGKVPFEVQVLDKTTGAAEVRLQENVRLNYEKRFHYKFHVVAKDCGNPARFSDPAVVVIRVVDVDEFAPKFENLTYFATIHEGKLYGRIITLQAQDGDRSDSYHKICGYEILTDDVPFVIDDFGNVKNTEPLDYKIHRNYILKVVAKDCGGKRSQPVFVNIIVEELCRSGWKDIADSTTYIAGSGQQKIMESAHLKICEEECSSPENVSVRMTLATKHIGKGCDRDTYSVKSQRKLCGASGESIDLLPSPSRAAWTKNLPTDDGHAADEIFAFDGKTTHVEVPMEHFNHTLREHFTISTWMKHEAHEDFISQHRAPKEHILCMSDGDQMSRHHYGLFVHGEKLVFLLRREATNADDMEVFKPAEWRWHIPQVNDGAWHHYAVSVDFPEVRLYIDGKLLIPDKTNLEIVDDWPLHTTHKVHFTKLVVGACWQGGEQKFEHAFRGYLGGLSLLKDKTESNRVIKCLNNCKENLDFHALSAMESGTSVSFNSEMTEFSISGKDIKEVEKLINEVTYINARTYPTPGRRNLKIETTVTCNGHPLQMPNVESFVMVQEPPKPIIVIDGSSNLTRLIYHFERGLRVFQDVYIYAKLEDEEETTESDNAFDKADHLAYKLSQAKSHQSTEAKFSLKDKFLLDTCTIKANPKLNLFYEHLSLPTHLMENQGLEWSETNDGVTITNADTIEQYLKVIQNIHYYHNLPDMLNTRTLTLSCSSQNQRFISNKLNVKLVALHEVPRVQPPANVEKAKNDPVRQKLLQSMNAKKAQEIAATTSSNFGMAAIIVVCVGFLLFMIILGVIRIRAAHRRTQVVHVDEKQEMEWDNSALNITVNPMEQEQVFDYEDNTLQSLRDDSDSDDDGSSFHDDGESSDEEPPRPVNSSELEWDHSNLSF